MALPLAQRTTHDLTGRRLVQMIEFEHTVPLPCQAQQLEVPRCDDASLIVGP